MIVLGFLVVLGTVVFIYSWHRRGDQFAQAEGALLTFIITGCSVAITLVYIYYTRESLSAAKAAVELQREQWNQHLRSDPQFWLVEDRRPSEMPFGMQDSAGKSISFRHQLNFYVWNSAEQSFRIRAVEIWVPGLNELPVQFYRPQGFVVKGQHLEKIAQRELNEKIAKVLIDSGCGDSSSSKIRLTIRVHYRTWEHADKVTESCTFLLQTRSSLQELEISEELVSE